MEIARNESTLKLEPVKDEPVFDIAPFSSRMAVAYMDKTGCCHLFTDYLDPDREIPEFFGGGPNNTNHTWDGVIRWYSSKDFKNWTDHGTVIDKGIWTGDPETSDADCIGAASPGVTIVGDRVFLFYSARGKQDPAGPFCSSLERGQKGALCGRIMLASAEIDENGCPEEDFVKHGVVVPLGSGWMSTRLDDPWPVVYENEVLLFHKAMGARKGGDGVVCALSRTDIDKANQTYKTDSEPAIKVSGGGEMARVFYKKGTWHLLYRHFHPGGQFWSHYMSDTPFNWKFVSNHLFDTSVKGMAGFTSGSWDGIPCGDLAPILKPFSSKGPELVIAAGLDDGTYGNPGVLKQWLYEIKT